MGAVTFLLSILIRSAATVLLLVALYGIFGTSTPAETENELPVDTIEEGVPWMYWEGVYKFEA